MVGKQEVLEEKWEKRPLIISGPCSAETEEQTVQTALQLAKTGKVDFLRAGIWKPRTKPGMFEGMGEKALPWLVKAKELTGLPVTIEVATTKHVEDALSFNIDMVWLGARTTVNPFSVQEIVTALKGVNIPILIKNPINADLELWSGAIERFFKAGFTKIGMVHRGFSSYGNHEYRNAPMWQLPIEMKRRFPEMMMLCDPSHICGRRDTLQKVAQKSIDLDFDGLMVETHIDPDNALSDAKQQITPNQFAVMLDNLIWRKQVEKEMPITLAELRSKIDHIDDELLTLLSDRMKIADEIGAFKKISGIKILQTQRWNEILERASQKCEALGLSKEFIAKYFDAVHLESINHQNYIMNKNL